MKQLEFAGELVPEPQESEEDELRRLMRRSQYDEQAIEVNVRRLRQRDPYALKLLAYLRSPLANPRNAPHGRRPAY